MKFEELPREVQMIAAKTLSDRFPSAGSSKSNGFEPATALAREVKEAFIELYSSDDNKDKARLGQDYPVAGTDSGIGIKE
ncbi:formyltetrahydrofolate deformylase [Yersinia enterocolitica]|nr:formyltetrahydrofolate deformylase [Yersinia enterocolitica]EKN6106567.1 formyltetrahydrofolate deformylase [Yersinia enterocolitica]